MFLDTDQHHYFHSQLSLILVTNQQNIVPREFCWGGLEKVNILEVENVFVFIFPFKV